jgi:hypothetical protein
MRKLLLLTLALGLAAARAPRASAADETLDILDRAIKAHGGQEKLTRLTALQYKAKGKFEMGGSFAYTQEATYQFPGRYKNAMEFEIQGTRYSVAAGYNGKEVWVTLNGKEQKIDAKLQPLIKESIYIGGMTQLVHLKGKRFQREPLGEIKVEGRPAVGVRISSKGHKDVNLFFDKKTGLLVKMEYRTGDVLGGPEFAATRVITEYMEADGIKTPKKSISYKDGEKIGEEEVTEASFSEKLDDSEFAKP